MCAVAHSRHVHTADMSTVSHSRQFCCVAEQNCFLCHSANVSVASHSRHICCVPQLNPSNKLITLFRPFANSQAITFSDIKAFMGGDGVRPEYLVTWLGEGGNILISPQTYQDLLASAPIYQRNLRFSTNTCRNFRACLKNKYRPTKRISQKQLLF